MINICVQQLTNPTICKMRQTCPLVANQQRLVVSSITEVMFTYCETYHNHFLSFLHFYRVFWLCVSLCFTCRWIIYDFRKGTKSNLVEKNLHAKLLRSIPWWLLHTFRIFEGNHSSVGYTAEHPNLWYATCCCPHHQLAVSAWGQC